MEFFNSENFGFAFTLVMYVITSNLLKNRKGILITPINLSMLTIGIFLVVFKIPLEYYEKGGNIWVYLLGPATVALGMSLYKQINKLKENALAITVGVILGSLSGIISVMVIGKLLGLDKVILLSIAPKSTTLAIGYEVANSLGGNPAITTAAIMVAGIVGNGLGEIILKVAGITDPTAKGVALGTASHALGTKRAIEIGEVEGAMASFSIAYAGLITAVLIPFVIKFFV